MGSTELFIVAGIVLVLFGGSQLPKLAKNLGSAQRELKKAIKEGEVAERAFVQSNLRLVVSIAKKYQASGLPLLDDAIAWIDCKIDRVEDIGDHLLVIGAVQALDRREDGTPLLFFRGKYHDVADLPDV